MADFSRQGEAPLEQLSAHEAVQFMDALDKAVCLGALDDISLRMQALLLVHPCENMSTLQEYYVKLGKNTVQVGAKLDNEDRKVLKKGCYYIESIKVNWEVLARVGGCGRDVASAHVLYEFLYQLDPDTDFETRQHLRGRPAQHPKERKLIPIGYRDEDSDASKGDSENEVRPSAAVVKQEDPENEYNRGFDEI